jgi:hypothetical protein
MSETLDRDVRLAIMRGFVEDGRPPAPDELARALDVAQIDAEAALRRLAEAHLIVLAPGTPYVWMANPFSAIPTSYRVRSGGRRWFGNCIWDALGILAAVGVDGRISTTCPDCGQPLELRTEGERISGDEAIVHYALPAARWWEDIGST